MTQHEIWYLEYQAKSCEIVNFSVTLHLDDTAYHTISLTHMTVPEATLLPSS